MDSQILKVLPTCMLNGIQRTSLVFAILAVLSIAILVVFIFLGLRLDPAYIWGLSILLPLGIVDIHVYRRIVTQRLLHQLRDIFANYHFAGQVTDKGLAFDFKLREGITPARNAIDLLRCVGYPQTIVEGAARRVL